MPRKNQYTIRGVSPEVDHALRIGAKKSQLSLNAYLLKELERIAEKADAQGMHHDLDFAIGSMSDGELVDQALAAFTKIDPEIWN